LNDKIINKKTQFERWNKKKARLGVRAWAAQLTWAIKAQTLGSRLACASEAIFFCFLSCSRVAYYGKQHIVCWVTNSNNHCGGWKNKENSCFNPFSLKNNPEPLLKPSQTTQQPQNQQKKKTKSTKLKKNL